MPRKVFIAGEILTAADVNTNLMDQAVMVFDDAAARDAAITSPIEGMVIYLEDTNAVQSYSGAAWVPAVNTASIVDGNVTTAKLGAGTILQVVSATKTGIQTISAGTTNALITDLEINITPRNASSKFLVMGTVLAAHTSGGTGGINLRRDDTTNLTTFRLVGDDSFPKEATGMFVDSPNTTSSVNYSLRVSNNTTSTFINRTTTSTTDYGDSYLVVMEVAG
jgi:hypothetical protein